MKVSKEELMLLIDTHFHGSLTQTAYKITTLNAKELLTHQRFDIAFKLLYLDGYKFGDEFSIALYNEHIRAFSLGEFNEPGNEDKNSIEKFHISFDDTYESIKINGFDLTKTVIPLSKHGSIVNGAHRVASAIHLDQDISCIKIDVDQQVYDYKFFYSRNVSTEMLDAAATKFIQYSQNIYIACVWPTASGKDLELEGIIPNIVYRKDVKLNENGAHNFLSQIYSGEEWLGSIADNYKGTQGKLIECFKDFSAVRFIVFQAESLDDVLKIKESVRSLFNVGKHSIHITDTKEEAVQLSSLVFNDNAIHFLNNGKPNKYIDTHNKIKKFKSFITDNDVSKNDVLLDSGMLLALYGFRKAKDLDYLSVGEHKIEFGDKGIEPHDEELKFHDENKSELLFNPKFYFYFDDIKFVSFAQLYRMKGNRNTTKDVNDRLIMEHLMESNWLKVKLVKLRQHFFYWRLKVRKNLVDMLKNIGMYELIRYLYRLFKI